MFLTDWPSIARRLQQGDPRLPAALWAGTRLFVLLMTATYFQGDTGTYHRYGRLWLEGQLPYRDFGVEYPPAAVMVFAAVALFGDHGNFRVAFALLCLLLDTLIFLALLRGRLSAGDEQRRWLASLLYAVSGALLFPVLYVRFDLLPAAATVAAVVWLAPAQLSVRRVATAGALLGLAIALKLYPLLLLPFALGHLLQRRARPAALLAGTAAAVAVAGACFLPWVAAGVAGAPLSFLQYQGERGLQIESSYASALLLVKPLLALDLRHVFTHQAHDIAGPAATAATALARLLQPAALVVVTALALVRRFSLVQGFAALLATAILTANVFSPQFLLWLLPFACAVVARRGWRAAALPAAIGLTSTLVFPALYGALTEGRWPAVLALFARNVLLGILLVVMSLPLPRRRELAT